MNLNHSQEPNEAHVAVTDGLQPRRNWTRKPSRSAERTDDWCSSLADSQQQSVCCLYTVSCWDRFKFCTARPVNLLGFVSEWVRRIGQSYIFGRGASSYYCFVLFWLTPSRCAFLNKVPIIPLNTTCGWSSTIVFYRTGYNVVFGRIISTLLLVFWTSLDQIWTLWLRASIGNCCDHIIMCGSFKNAASITYHSVECSDDSEWRVGRKWPQSACSWPDMRCSCVLSGTMAWYNVAWSDLSCHPETKKRCKNLFSREFFRMEVRKYLDCVSQRVRSAWRNCIYIYIQGVTGGTDQTSGGCSLC